jgi:hypothetical protein
MESKCKRWGEEFRDKDKCLTMSPQEKYISVYGDAGQADRLVNAKKINQNSPGSPFLPNQRTNSNGPSKGILSYQTRTPPRNLTPASLKQGRSPFHK